MVPMFVTARFTGPAEIDVGTPTLHSSTWTATSEGEVDVGPGLALVVGAALGALLGAALGALLGAVLELAAGAALRAATGSADVTGPTVDWTVHDGLAAAPLQAPAIKPAADSRTAARRRADRT